MLLKVTDSGFGMDQQTLTRIFDPYFTTKKQGEGTGLGFSFVNGIVKSTVAVSTSTASSAFNIYLPCSQTEEQMERVERSDAELPTGTERVLVVDDERQVGQMTCDSLELLGYQPSYYRQASAALEAFSRDPQQYDLVVTDMTMPKMTGLDLLKSYEN
jgi:PleD family two-component response regulator